MHLQCLYTALSDTSRREVEKVLLQNLGNLACAVARECKDPDGFLPENLLRDLSSAASTYRGILRRAGK